MTKEELKQEAEEYAEGMAKYYASTHEGFIPSQFEKYLRNACVSSAEPREKHIAELEKENAELKEQQFSLRNERNTFLAQNEQYEKDLIDLNESLTKAKEIIKMLHSDCYSIAECEDTNLGLWEDDLAKAEAFLNSKVEE